MIAVALIALAAVVPRALALGGLLPPAPEAKTNLGFAPYDTPTFASGGGCGLSPEGYQTYCTGTYPTRVPRLAARYAQCGDQESEGPAICETPYKCTAQNEYYSQCL